MNNFKITEFPPEVLTELKYYVYRLIDPRNGETFYVGKGIGNHLFQHIKCAVEDDNEDDIDLKFQRIRNITKSGLEVIHVIHRHGLDNDTAYHVESALIDAYPGTTNVVSGHLSNDLGPMNAFEILNRYKAEVVEFEHRVLIISINKSIEEKSIYDATRFAWKLDVNRAKKAEYILAVEKGIIVGVFVAHDWYLARKQYFPNFENHTNKRYGFEGEEASKEICDFYLRKRIPDEYRKKGASNPIKYSYR